MKKFSHALLFLSLLFFTGCAHDGMVNEDLVYQVEELVEDDSADSELEGVDFELSQTHLLATTYLGFGFNEEDGVIELDNLPTELGYHYSNALDYIGFLSVVYQMSQFTANDQLVLFDEALYAGDFEAAESHLQYAIDQQRAYISMMKDFEGYQGDESLRNSYSFLMGVSLRFIDSKYMVVDFAREAGGWDNISEHNQPLIEDYIGSNEAIVLNAMMDEVQIKEEFILKYADEFTVLIDDMNDVDLLEQLTGFNFIELLDLDEALFAPIEASLEDDVVESSTSDGDPSVELEFVYNNELDKVEILELPDDSDYFYENVLDYYIYLKKLHDTALREGAVKSQEVLNELNEGNLDEAQSKLTHLINQTTAFKKMMDDVEGYQGDTSLRDAFLESIENHLSMNEGGLTQHVQVITESGGMGQLNGDDALYLDSIVSDIAIKMSDSMVKLEDAESGFLIAHGDEMDRLISEYES